MPRFSFPRVLVVLNLLVASAAAQSRDAWSALFLSNPEWAAAESVSLADNGARLAPAGNTGRVFYHTGAKPGGVQLRARDNFGDCVLRMEFMLPARGRAALFFAARYRLTLDAEAMGAAGPPVEADAVIKDAAPPLAAAAGQPGAWQTLEVKFRAPRLDDARNMIAYGLFMEVTINGKLVQSNTLSKRSRGSEHMLEDSLGPITIGVEQGGFAFRNFSLQPANFEAVRVPAVSGQATNVASLIDFVKEGEQLHKQIGCIECHAVQRGDTSMKSGPNLFGLFTVDPRERAVIAAEGKRFTVKVDRAYLQRSLRNPHEELAIAEQGPNEGKPFQPVMPPYASSVISNAQIDALAAYLLTLNDGPRQGPVVHLVERTGPKDYDPMADRYQMLIDQTVRIQRGPLLGVSARAISVGQPNGLNYSFDPRVLGVAKVWQGGFLDMGGEWRNRGGGGLKTGFESREIDLGETAVLLAPLDARGNRIDFSFKEARFGDLSAVRESLNSPRDHLERLAETDAQFLGYTRDSRNPKAVPTFNYRVGRNTLGVRTEIGADGQVSIHLQGELAAPQTFLVNPAVLGAITVSAGELRGDRWTLPAGKHADAVARGRVTLASSIWRPKPSTFTYLRQPMTVTPSTPVLPRGYRAETYGPPKDNYGRELLFEPLGLALARDGTLVVASRTSGVWRLVRGEWQLFAEGLFDSLGVEIEDERGLQIVVGQKAELTRISDTNGDGLADSFVTMTDAFSYHGNYHVYMHGPVRDVNGDYIVTLNLDHPSDDIMYKAGGRYMGTSGGYRGWAIRVPARGGFEPYADGLRSPSGLGRAPDGRLWYVESQGEYVGTSKIFVLKKGAFYGHPSGLVDRKGLTPASPELAWENVWKNREPAVVLLPHNRVANSPGHPAWDTTGGRFGPFAGQILVGDQTRSILVRVATEVVAGREQGVAITFGTALESGVMRPLFLPDGSLLLGQTGRGWQARGGRVASLQRLVWDGETVAPAIHHVNATPTGFALHFTTAVPAAIADADLAKALVVKSWVYRDAPDYGSPEMDEHVEPVSRLELSPDRRSLRVTLEKTEQPQIHPQQTARVYHLALSGQSVWGEMGRPGFDAYYTLYQFPTARSASGAQ